MTLDQAQMEATKLLQIFVGWLVSPQFYAQIGAVVIAVALAHFAHRQIKSKNLISGMTLLFERLMKSPTMSSWAKEKAIIFALGYWVAGTNGHSSNVHFLV